MTARAVVLFLALCGSAGRAAAAPELSDMTGCWVTERAEATSLETDSATPDGVRVVFEKMLLMFDRMEQTEHLVVGRIYEWNERAVLGPQYQNGLFDPVARTVTFGFPEGGLDTVHALDRDTLLYVHKKSSTLSAMSVRRMSRLECGEAGALERELLGKKEAGR